MAMIDGPKKVADASVEGDGFDSALQLRLAASLVSRLVERNGGSSAAADLFWDEDSFDTERDQEEYLDLELPFADVAGVPNHVAR